MYRLFFENAQPQERKSECIYGYAIICDSKAWNRSVLELLRRAFDWVESRTSEAGIFTERAYETDSATD